MFSTMHSLQILFGFAAVFIFASEGYAGSHSYVCTVEGFNRLTHEGTLKASLDDPIIGKEFTVDRKSGKIIGRYIGSDAFDLQVLDPGSLNQSFKVMGTTRPFLHVLYLQIEEFVEEGLKPFLLIDGSLVYSGRCS
jgi:hypothetical protein